MPTGPARPPPRHPAGTLLYGGLLLHTLISGATYLCAKWALREIPPLTLGLLRFGVASTVLVLLLRHLRPAGSRLPPRAAWRKILLLSFLAVPLNQGFFLLGLARTSAAHAALLYALTPLFVLLLAQALLREFPGPLTAAGAVIALGGTLFVLLGRVDLGAGIPWVGDLLVLGAVVAWAAYTTAGRALVAEHGALPTIAWTLIGGTLLYLPIGLGSLVPAHARGALAQASAQAWMGVLFLSLGTSVCAYLIWYWALGHLPAARVAVFSYLQPLATALLARAFLGERIGGRFFAGALVVIAGVLLAQKGRLGRPGLPVTPGPPAEP